MRADQRLWRTNDDRLVAEGDPDAATLAYTVGDDIAPRDEGKLPRSEGPAGEEKAARRPANKAADKPANKGV
ncbi:hypothetical protein [Sphaerisporangium sp. TRM90804]|uniref:hypothetical protein n=1 Tax=Sphaerisporangium sp. TRM90804 TaxID=3031113 RepID=UPI00244A21BC|nr:hypothetical protein [Sphaerisporangium sp. TRM90804]MDH2429323.1 hypothetical protein [Sphaerisporangium sp. TRM90804]